MSRPPRYATVIVDVDSTLCGVEGIDWLARRAGPDVFQRTERLTRRAMEGDVSLESVYGDRLALIRPSRADVDALASHYVRQLASHAVEVVGALRGAGVRVVLVSGGIRSAIEPVAHVLGLSSGDLCAVALRWTTAGDYTGFDADSPLTTQHGKREIVRQLRPERPALAVGDGATDVEMRSEVDAFAAYTGFVRRDRVVQRADLVFGSFEDLRTHVLGT